MSPRTLVSGTTLILLRKDAREEIHSQIRNGYAQIRTRYAPDTHGYANGYARIRTDTHRIRRIPQTDTHKYARIRTGTHRYACPVCAYVFLHERRQLAHFHSILCVPGCGAVVQLSIIFAALLLSRREFLLFAARMCWTSIFRGDSVGFGSNRHVFVCIFAGASVRRRILQSRVWASNYYGDVRDGWEMHLPP